jgi:hypothetical protein
MLKDIHRKSFHIDKLLITQKFIHRKKFYINHEKDPHLAGMISTRNRKKLHVKCHNLMKNKE